MSGKRIKGSHNASPESLQRWDTEGGAPKGWPDQTHRRSRPTRQTRNAHRGTSGYDQATTWGKSAGFEFLRRPIIWQPLDTRVLWLKSALKLNSELRSLSYARRLQGWGRRCPASSQHERWLRFCRSASWCAAARSLLICRKIVVRWSSIYGCCRVFIIPGKRLSRWALSWHCNLARPRKYQQQSGGVLWRANRLGYRRGVLLEKSISH